MFNLTFHGHLSYEAAWNMPVEIRRWWIEKIRKANEPKEENQGGRGPAPWNRGK